MCSTKSLGNFFYLFLVDHEDDFTMKSLGDSRHTLLGSFQCIQLIRNINCRVPFSFLFSFWCVFGGGGLLLRLSCAFSLTIQKCHQWHG